MAPLWLLGQPNDKDWGLTSFPGCIGTRLSRKVESSAYNQEEVVGRVF